jgi:hypothetical protein
LQKLLEKISSHSACVKSCKGSPHTWICFDKDAPDTLVSNDMSSTLKLGLPLFVLRTQLCDPELHSSNPGFSPLQIPILGAGALALYHGAYGAAQAGPRDLLFFEWWYFLTVFVGGTIFEGFVTHFGQYWPVKAPGSV